MKISIITVTLNSALTIRDTLNSVGSQTYKNIEHIIVDGGSNDETLSILKKYSNKKAKTFIKKILVFINLLITQLKNLLVNTFVF